MQLLTIAVLLPLALGLPSSIYSDFQPARVGDSRSPCPALNSLANHNILPRNGRGISLPILIAALKSESSSSSFPQPRLTNSPGGLNVGADFSTAIGSFGLSTAPALLSPTFDLDNLDKHGESPARYSTRPVLTRDRRDRARRVAVEGRLCAGKRLDLPPGAIQHGPLGGPCRPDQV